MPYPNETASKSDSKFDAVSRSRSGLAKRWFDVTTKNRRAKTVPMSPPLLRLLERFRERATPKPKPTDRVFPVDNPRQGMATACKSLGFPKFTVHALRHFFITNAIEAGLDFRAVAGLVNHSDGGALLARRYAHLRDTHLAASVAKLTFDATASEPDNVVPIRTGTQHVR